MYRKKLIRVKKLLAVILVFLMMFTFAACDNKTDDQDDIDTKTGDIQTQYADKYIDLHLHLDGAITTDIARELADIQGIELPTEDEEELKALLTVPEDCTDLNDFLKCFSLPQSLLQTEDGIREAVRLVADNIKSQGVIYAEIRFSPQKLTNQGLTQEDTIKAALAGLKETDLKANLILCVSRGEDNHDANVETVELAHKYLVEDGGVVAIDIAGAEALYPTADYRDIFELARGYGIPFTIHAGEADGAESVKLAIEFGASRIGHGTRSYESEEVMNLLKSKNIALEMCPTSNRQTHAVEDMSEYPFMDYLERGIKVTLNTDDMGIEGTTLADEFRYMEKEFGLTAEQEKVILENSVEAAFTSDSVKEELRSILWK